MVKRFAILLLAVINMLMMTSCWDYRELEELAIIGGFAIDKDKIEEKYTITVEIINPTMQEQGDGISKTIVKVKGDTVFDAIRNIVPRIGKRAYWGHSKVLVISKSIAEEDILQVIDWVERDAEVRSDMFVLISGEESAGDILEINSPLERLVSLQIKDSLRKANDIPKFPSIDIWTLTDIVSSKHASLLLPVITISKTNDSTRAELGGGGVFQGQKLIGMLNESDVKRILWVRDEVSSGLINVKRVLNKPINMSMEIYSSKTDVEPIYNGKDIMMKVNIKPTVEIAELSKFISIKDEKNVQQIRSFVEDYLESIISKTIDEVQKKYGTDIFKFGEEVMFKYPELWKNIEDTWQSKFSDLRVVVKVDLKIRGSATIDDPVKAGD
jgi:spore germination protein KC